MDAGRKNNEAGNETHFEANDFACDLSQHRAFVTEIVVCCARERENPPLHPEHPHHTHCDEYCGNIKIIECLF